MSPNQNQGRRDTAAAEAVVLGKLDRWLQPELGLAFRVMNMYVQSILLPGKEEESKAASTQDGRTHGCRILRIRTLRREDIPNDLIG